MLGVWRDFLLSCIGIVDLLPHPLSPKRVQNFKGRLNPAFSTTQVQSPVESLLPSFDSRHGSAGHLELLNEPLDVTAWVLNQLLPPEMHQVLIWFVLFNLSVPSSFIMILPDFTWFAK